MPVLVSSSQNLQSSASIVEKSITSYSLGELAQELLAPHVPIQHTVRTFLKTSVESSVEFFDPLSRISSVKAKHQTIPIGDLQSGLPILDPLLLRFAGDGGFRIVQVFVILVVCATELWAQ